MQKRARQNERRLGAKVRKNVNWATTVSSQFLHYPFHFFSSFNCDLQLTCLERSTEFYVPPSHYQKNRAHTCWTHSIVKTDLHIIQCKNLFWHVALQQCVRIAFSFLILLLLHMCTVFLFIFSLSLSHSRSVSLRILLCYVLSKLKSFVK